MIDIHTHILPSVDDGAKNIDISLGLLKEEIEQGNKYIVLTPHQNKDNLNKEFLISEFNKFKTSVNLDISLFLGCELYYYLGAIKDLKEGKILTINNSNYVLVEFSTRDKTDIANVVYDMSISGFKPIVAHIERYPYLEEKDILEISKYASIQVNSNTFKSKEHKKLLKFLLKNNLISFVASDCHNLDSRNCDFYEAKRLISKKYKDAYKKIFETIPEFLKL